MTYSPHAFSRGLERSIAGGAYAIAMAARAEATADHTGPAAIARLGAALRGERFRRQAAETRLADTEAELIRLYDRIEAAERRLRQRPSS